MGIPPIPRFQTKGEIGPEGPGASVRKIFVLERRRSTELCRGAAPSLGKQWRQRGSGTVHQDHTAYTDQRVEEYLIKPHEFRNLPDHTAVVRHCGMASRRLGSVPRNHGNESTRCRKQEVFT